MKALLLALWLALICTVISAHIRSVIPDYRKAIIVILPMWVILC
ncbi:MAG: hypothetical protein V8R14_06440 [Clostridia bacterium]